MNSSVYVFDPTKKDILSAVRGIGRYLQLLKENFPNWTFTGSLPAKPHSLPVFINPFFNFLSYPSLTGRIAKRQIAVIHDLIPLKYPTHFPVGVKGKINVFLNKLVLKNYDLIVTDSEASKNDIVRMLKIKPEKVKVIYPCLPNIFTNLEFKIQNSILNSQFSILNSKFCLYVGDATWNKNLVNIAKAVKIADVNCVFVGKVFASHRPPSTLENGWLLEFKQFIAETKNDKRFIFAGFLPDKELIKLYQQARLNILLSRDEGFGFSYLEAANFGCPSVLSDTSVLKELAGENNALFAGPDSPSDIANKIKQIYFDDELRSELGLRAQQRAKKYSNDNFKKEFTSLIL